MANPGYVRSTDGNNADNGSTWALANADFSGAIADAAAGDAIYASQAHAGTYAAATTLTFPGTKTAPNKIACVNDAAEPPTALATGGSEGTAGSTAYTMNINGSFYCYGMRFYSSNNGNGALGLCQGDGNAQIYENCAFELTNTGTATGRILLGSTSNANESYLELVNCTFRFGNVGHGIRMAPTRFCRIKGGSLDAASAAITTFVNAVSGSSVNLEVVGFDFSNAASTLNLWITGETADGYVEFRNLRLPASWSGGLIGGAIVTPGFRIAMYNSDNADTHYRVWIEDFAGTIRDETTLVMTGGAADEQSQAIAWKMTSNAGTNPYVAPLVSDDMVMRNTAVGSALTLTVDILHDSATALTDLDIWMEVEVLGTSGVPVSTLVTNKCGLLTTPGDHTTSSENWTTTGLTNPNKQKLTVSITPQEYGEVRARVCLGKASTTVYVNAEFTLS